MLSLGLSAAGCAPAPTGTGLSAIDPTTKLQAIERAIHERDREAVPALVEQLDSDDPAVRLLAITALQRITGTTMGYDHAASARERDAATTRWATAVAAGTVPQAEGGEHG